VALVGLVGAFDPRERPATAAFSFLSKARRLLKSIIHFVCFSCCVLMILDDVSMDDWDVIYQEIKLPPQAAAAI
jgi:hypothetical protein